MEKKLRLPVNEYWYNLIKSGKLTHDYREIKPYWSKRLDGQTYDIVEFYHRFKKDIKPLRYKFEWIKVGRLVNYNMDAYIIKFGDEINSIEEGLFTATVKRGYTDEKRKEDVVKILYRPETKDKLKKVIRIEIKKQGGIDIDLRMIDVSKVDDMSFVFDNCKSLQSLDVSNWNVSNVKDMDNMFSDCSSLQSLDVSNWNVSNVKDMSFMFDNCSSLQSLDLSKWDVSNVEDMRYMFSGCSSLQSLDLSKWDVSNVKNMDGMFADCSSLKSFDLSKWDVSNVKEDMEYMFDDCPIKYEKQGNKLVRI